MAPFGIIDDNIFVIYTPSLGNSSLGSLTRNCAINIAQDLGYTIRETVILREMLYLADEIFFTGTVVEITPVRSVDCIEVGTGKRGPITEAIQSKFFGIVEGKLADKWGWLTPVALSSKFDERTSAC